jgi:YVTN family beta-propeller protein
VAHASATGVSVIDTGTNAVTTTVSVGASFFLAVTPDGSRVYVVNTGAGTVSVIDAVTNSTIGGPIAVGLDPFGIAITPEGGTAYVANSSSASVSVISTATNTVVTTVSVGSSPYAVAVTPDGAFAYVTLLGPPGSVVVIDTASNTVVGTPIAVGGNSPQGIAIRPDGAFAYVTSTSDGIVAVINTATNTVTTTVTVGSSPFGIAIAPDGTFAYVANSGSGDVRAIDLSTNTVIGVPIVVGPSPRGVAMRPDGAVVYVTDSTANEVWVIDTNTRTVVGSPIPVGGSPFGVAVVSVAGGCLPTPEPTATATPSPTGTEAPSTATPALPSGTGCTEDDLATKNAEKCARTYFAALKKCIKKGNPLATCDRSKSTRFCSQLSAECTPTRDVDALISLVYGSTPTPDKCLRQLAKQGAKLIAKRLKRQRTGQDSKLATDYSRCVSSAARGCTGIPSLLPPCEASTSLESAAACVCTEVQLLDIKPVLVSKSVAVSFPILQAHGIAPEQRIVSTLLSEVMLGPGETLASVTFADVPKGQLLFVTNPDGSPFIVAYFSAAEITSGAVALDLDAIARGLIMSNPVMVGFSDADRVAILGRAETDPLYASLRDAIDDALGTDPTNLLNETVFPIIYEYALQLIIHGVQNSAQTSARTGQPRSAPAPIVGSSTVPYFGDSPGSTVTVVNPTMVFYGIDISGHPPRVIEGKDSLWTLQLGWPPTVFTDPVAQTIDLGDGRFDAALTKWDLYSTAGKRAGVANFLRGACNVLDFYLWCPISNSALRDVVQGSIEPALVTAVGDVFALSTPGDVVDKLGVIIDKLKEPAVWGPVTRALYASAADKQAAITFLSNSKSLLKAASTILGAYESANIYIPFVYDLIVKPDVVSYCLQQTGGTLSGSCQNIPPSAIISRISPEVISVGNSVTFDASQSSDDLTSASALQVRWDFDGDGLFDTTWTTNKQVARVYTTVGDYSITLEVMDSQGLVGRTVFNLSVRAAPATMTPTNTRTRTPTSTPSKTGAPTSTPTRTASNTPTSAGAPSNTPTRTPTRTNTFTNTPTSTNTPNNGCPPGIDPGAGKSCLVVVPYNESITLLSGLISAKTPESLVPQGLAAC